MMQKLSQPHQISWRVPIFIGIVSFIIRCIFIHYWPDAFQYDAYQRWAARDYLFVQVWLPGAQVWVWLLGKLGGTMLHARYVFAFISAISLVLGARLAQQLSTERAGFFFLPAICFGPYLVWGSAPYQESTLLLFLFSSLLLFKKYPRISDFLMGGVALVRYEGWPLLFVHLYLRRRREAIICLWGVVLLVVLGMLGLNEPYGSSPDSFDDWKGLALLTQKRVWFLFRGFLKLGYNSGAFWIFGFSLIAFYKRKLEKEEWMLVFTFLGQAAAVVGWMFSLGIAFSRMMILLTIPMGVLAAAGLDRHWTKMGPWKFVLVGGLTVLSLWGLYDAYTDYKYYKKSIRWEIQLLSDIQKCSSDNWAITPRPHPGPRNRHDGCEVIQGLSNLKVGQEFDCTTWEWGGPEPTISAIWNTETRKYDIQRVRGKSEDVCPW